MRDNGRGKCYLMLRGGNEKRDRKSGYIMMNNYNNYDAVLMEFHNEWNRQGRITKYLGMWHDMGTRPSSF